MTPEQIENFIETNHRKIRNEVDLEYLHLYETVTHRSLKEIFSTLHAKLISSYDSMNERLPTGEDGAHFWAEPSRTLLFSIKLIEGLKRGLTQTEHAFMVDDYYVNLINQCKTFLSSSGGSALPPHMDEVTLYFNLPIFRPDQSVRVQNKVQNSFFNLSQIGSGSYALVYKYRDDYYQKNFVIKRAKKDLNNKELQRFKQEYEQLASMNSPYVVEVYRYNDNENEYIMEYMDYSLKSFIEKYNSKLNPRIRKNICGQIIKAFLYIHSKNILHRDICPQNVLIKVYEGDMIVVKIADFGLVRLPESQLTTINTDFKGYFNDPGLILEGFSSYSIFHETYAIARLLYYVMTGRTNCDKVENRSLSGFLKKGLSSDKRLRFESVEELADSFWKIEL